MSERGEQGLIQQFVAEAFAPGASVYAVARQRDLVPGQIYRRRNELRSAILGFTAVVVAPEASERVTASAPAGEIELGRDIRVRFTATAPEEMASAIIKALAAR